MEKKDGNELASLTLGFKYNLSDFVTGWYDNHSGASLFIVQKEDIQSVYIS